jgi:hypothetical protein
MASTGQLTVDWGAVDLSLLAALPARLDDAQLATVKHIASLPVPALPPAPEKHFLQCMRTLRLLPTRGDDDLSGELRLALYRKHFGQMPAAALSYLVEQATLTCRFFPTPMECKAILDRWSRTDGPHRAQQLAEVAAAREVQARFDDVMQRLRMGEVSQAEVDALPERWKRIAACQGHLRDGTYQLRPRVPVPAMGVEDEQGQRPAVLDEQHSPSGPKAGGPHERTNP